jgi:hypothetical protein
MSFGDDPDADIKTIIWWLFWIVWIPLSLYLLLSINGCVPNYSDGERTGVIVKASIKGLIFKSHEATMGMGMMGPHSDGKTTVMAPVQWEFSCVNLAVWDQIVQAAASGQQVTLHYHQYFIAPMRLSTDYVVDSLTNVP